MTSKYEGLEFWAEIVHGPSGAHLLLPFWAVDETNRYPFVRFQVIMSYQKNDLRPHGSAPYLLVGVSKRVNYPFGRWDGHTLDLVLKEPSLDSPIGWLEGWYSIKTRKGQLYRSKSAL